MAADAVPYRAMACAGPYRAMACIKESALGTVLGSLAGGADFDVVAIFFVVIFSVLLYSLSWCDLLGGFIRWLGGFRSPGDYAVLEYLPNSRHYRVSKVVEIDFRHLRAG